MEHRGRNTKKPTPCMPACISVGGDQLPGATTGVLQGVGEDEASAQACDGLCLAGAIFQSEVLQAQQMVEDLSLR